ncbi:NAD-glutamate dehydrogenase domain-containing protein [Rhodococcus sp. NPDC057529]|uniref:NAD-glutamate dehydrogenase domain-containing protein n=1 Tax=Rhodococcus sp. NPDC057529 TaxID=3346158 RepID=UPI00366D767F
MSSTLSRVDSAGLPDGYQADQPRPPAPLNRTLLDSLQSGGLEVELRTSEHDQPFDLRIVLYSGETELSLDDVVPILHSLGIGVVDERPTAVQRSDGLICRIYDFGITTAASPEAQSVDAQVADRLLDAFHAGWDGSIELDSFNKLILSAGLDWRQCAVLRTYAKYLQQATFPYPQQRIAAVLLDNPCSTKALVELFESKFDPSNFPDPLLRPPNQPDASVAAQEISKVLSLDADRILRAYLSLIEATTRTNHYSKPTRNRPLALKIAAGRVTELPEPRPQFEAFVCSPRVEGTHLRFGVVARGGLRWSDRIDDYRTEVLGLVKAQAVKNSVIVPLGAKGVFVVRKQTQLTGSERSDQESLHAEAVYCYREFISSLIDLTDNRNAVTGEIETPDRVVRYDEDDAYLVVAADKGTARFSDIANAIAQDRGFWLGDAFASGGSLGYDHKQMGITARGAWASVQRHLREIDIDDQLDDYTVAGIGDMSGDVFGNGMMLSESLRLIAAFDHRHIFVDPNPEPGQSFRERKRLFELPQSSWADYNPDLISDGGGVWSRTSKSITLSEQVRTALGISGTVSSLTPPQLIQAILRAPVDLLWNAGVGTYVKASNETHLDASDKANDSVRVDASDVRARIVGEGGNLGFTQRGRIEFAQSGGAINTDALDNSAGVSCSDHEVNIKILLDGLVRSEDISSDERATMLGEMTGQVASLVLAENTSQNELIGEARFSAAPFTKAYARLTADLEDNHQLNRALEALPTPIGFEALTQAEQGLTSPELATLAAHTKLALKADLQRSDFLDHHDLFDNLLCAYFPTPISNRFPDAIRNHPLRREIIATQLVNKVVDRGGITYALRLSEETGASTTDVVRAYATASSIFGFDGLWTRIHNRTHSAEVTYALTTEVRRLLDRASRWLLANRPQPLAVGAEIRRFGPLISQLSTPIGAWLRGTEHASVQSTTAQWVERGLHPTLARDVSELLFRYSLLDIIEAADVTTRDPFEVAELYFSLSDHLQIDKLLIAVSSLPREERWNALARLALRDDLYRSLRTLTQDVCTSTCLHDNSSQKLMRWESVNAARLARSRTTLREIANQGVYTLATLSVAAREIRTMAQTQI